MLNGHLTADQLVTIDEQDHQLAPDAARAYLDALAAGLPPGGVREGYRDHDTQVQYSDNPPNHLGLAARPGTSSHGYGQALDLEPEQASWFDQHPEYGYRQTIPAEGWHREHLVRLDTHTTPPRPTPTTAEDDTMAFTATDSHGQDWHCSGVLRRPISRAQREALARLYPPATVPYLQGIGDEALAGFADIGGVYRPTVTIQE